MIWARPALFSANNRFKVRKRVRAPGSETITANTARDFRAIRQALKNPQRKLNMSDETNPSSAASNFESAKAHAKDAVDATKAHLKDAVDQSKEHFKSAAEDLRAAAEAKAREFRGTAEAKAKEFRETAGAKADEFRGRAEQSYGEARERVRTLQEDGEAYIRENPTKAVLTAVVAGFLLGLVFRR
jgi:ElaB/YqjD/DUF883 family membrane-anchored ribosome-binding protein